MTARYQKERARVTRGLNIGRQAAPPSTRSGVVPARVLAGSRALDPCPPRKMEAAFLDPQPSPVTHVLLGRDQQIFSYPGQMLTHGGTRRVRVVSLESVKYLLMFVDGRLNAGLPRASKEIFAQGRLVAHVPQHLDDSGEDVVLRHPRQRHVKRAVGLFPRCLIEPLVSNTVNKPLHFADLLFGRQAGRKRRNLSLEQPSGLDHLKWTSVAVDRRGAGGAGVGEHEDPGAMPGLNQPTALQNDNIFPDHRTAAAQLLR